MRNCGQILEKEILLKKVKRADLCEFIGIAPPNLSKLLKKESLDSSVLEKMCQYLNLDPADFFDYRPEYTRSGLNVGSISQDVKIGDAKVAIGSGEIELLRKLLEEKDQRIKSLERTIELLGDMMQYRKSATKNVDDERTEK